MNFCIKTSSVVTFSLIFLFGSLEGMQKKQIISLLKNQQLIKTEHLTFSEKCKSYKVFLEKHETNLPDELTDKKDSQKTEKKSLGVISQISLAYLNSIMSSYAHEFGHGATFGYFFPGSCRGIKIALPIKNGMAFRTTGKFSWNVTKIIKDPRITTPSFDSLVNELNNSHSLMLSSERLSYKLKIIAGLTAGPLFGVGFCLTSLGGLSFLEHYRNSKNLKESFNKFKKDPLHWEENSFLKSALIYLAYFHFCQLVPMVFSDGNGSDGRNILNILGTSPNNIQNLGNFSSFILLPMLLENLVFIGIGMSWLTGVN